MNRPAVTNSSLTLLKQRLSRQKPLYRAIHDDVAQKKVLHAEALEPRLLLAADLVVAADILADGIEATGDALDDFFDSSLFNTDIPLLVMPAGDSVATVTLNDLLSMDPDLNGDASVSGALELKLKDYDSSGNNNGKVSLKEFVHGAFINPLKAELAGLNASATNAELVTFLQGLAADFNGTLAQATSGNLSLDINNVAVTDAADGGSLEFSLDFDLDFGKQLPFDLGSQFEDLGIVFDDAALHAVVNTSLSFGFDFGVDNVTAAVVNDPSTAADESKAASADFYIKLDDLQASTSASLGLVTNNVQLGFLGLSSAGTLNLAAGINANLQGGNNKLSLAELNDTEGLTDNYNFVTSGAGVTGSVTLTVDSGLSGLSKDVQFTINSPNPFTTVKTDGRFDLVFVYNSMAAEDLLNFARLSPSAFVGLLGQVSEFLGGLSNSDLISGIEIPFAEASVGDILNFAEVLSDKLLYDVDAVAGSRAKLMDMVDGALTPTFDTVQELVSRLATILYSGGSGLNAAYDAATNELSMVLTLADTFKTLLTPIDFSLDLLPIANVSNASGVLVLSGSGNVTMTLGIALGDVQASDKITTATKLNGSDQLNNAIVPLQYAAITGTSILDFSPISTNLIIAGVTLVLDSADMTANTNIYNLVTDINDAIDESELAGKIVVSSVGNRLVISATDTFTGSLTVVENAELGFTDGDATPGETITGNLNDFVVSTMDGNSYGVSLQGITTINGLMTAIADATSNKVAMTISANGTNLVLTDTTSGPVANKFHIDATNNSKAALRLGIVATDADRNGVIEGGVIAGPTLADRTFIDNATLSGQVGLSATNVSASADFGFAAVTLAGAGQLGLALTTTLKNPIVNAVDTSRMTLAQLQANLGQDDNGNRNIEKVVSLPTISGNLTGGTYGKFDLTVGLDSDAPGLDLLGGLAPSISLTVTDIGLPFHIADADLDGEISEVEADAAEDARPIITIDTSALDVLPIGKLADIGISDILDGIIAVTDILGTFEAFGFLSDPIPLIDVSINDILSFADKLDAAVQNAFDDPAGTIQALEGSLRSAFGLPSDSDLVSLALVDEDGNENAAGGILRINLTIGTSFNESIGIDFDLADLIADLDLDPVVAELLNQASLAGSAGLTASGAISLTLAFGIDLGFTEEDDLGDIWIFEETGLLGTLSVVGADLTFRGAIGPAGLFVQEGDASIEIILDAGFEDDLLIFDLAGDDNDESGLIAFDDIVDDLSASLTGTLEATLPVYLPTDSFFAGDLTISGSISAEYDPSDDESLSLAASLDVGGLQEILAKFDPSQMSLMDNILLVVEGVDLFLEGLQDALDGEMGGVSLPLVGDSLVDGVRFIEDFRSTFVDKFREGVASFSSDGENIVTILLNDLLANLGIATHTVVFTTNFDTPSTPVKEVFMQWNITLADTLIDVGTDINFDLGIPGLGLKTEGSVNMAISWQLDLGFGLSFAQGAYIDISDPDELTFTVDVTVPGIVLTGSIGFMQLEATENEADAELVDENGESLEQFTHLSVTFGVNIINGSDAEAERLGFADLGDVGFEITIAADALADLSLTLKLNSDIVPGEASVFPEVTADFRLEWAIEGKLTELGDLIQEGLQLVEFTDVSLDFGSFLSDFLAPVLAEVQTVTAPLQEILDFITSPLPVISDLGPDLSLLDIAQAFGKVNLGFIESMADVVSLINSIPTETESLIVNFGDFTVFDINNDALNDATLTDKKTNTAALAKAPGAVAANPNPLANTNPTTGANKTALAKMKSAGAFAFPILTDPSQIFGMLMGDEAILMTFDMKPLIVDFKYSQYFPIFGPLGASITGSLGVRADFAFGFDTLGISQFSASDFTNPALIFNGFYVSDTLTPDGSGEDVPELTINLSLAAAAELNLGVARGGVAGGVFADIYFNLFDPDHDGRVRIEEIVGSIITQAEYGGDLAALAPLAVFDVTGEIYAKLYAFLDINLALFQLHEKFDITPPITLLDFEIPFVRMPQLATMLEGGVLQLNMGEMAELRLNGNISDDDEIFTVTTVSGGVNVSYNDGVHTFTQKYATPTKIIALAGEGNDTINLSGVTSNIVFEIVGGAGDDTILLGSGSGSSGNVDGGAGDDDITGSGGDDIIIGGLGHDIIRGLAGADVLFGDGVKFADGTIRVRVQKTDGDDTVSGGDGDDIIFGGGGDDILSGGLNDDLILGDGGLLTSSDDSFSLATVTVTESDRGTVGGFDTVNAGAGLDVVYGGRGDDTINGDGDDDLIYGDSGQDIIHGNSGADTLFGGDDNDDLWGDAGDDWLSGDDGADSLAGNANDDILFGGAGNDLLHGNDGNDTLRGGADPDKLYGDFGNDYLDGDAGDDLVFGDTGTFVAELEADTTLVIVPGLRDDRLVSSYGNDILDGEAGGDIYIINLIGGNTEKLVTVFDTGNAVSGSDELRIYGSVEVSYDEATELTLARTYLQADDKYLLRANPDLVDGLAFVALMNDDDVAERIDYSNAMESMEINSGLGDDYFALDDNRAQTTINGGEGDDVFQVGQMFNLPRTTDEDEGAIQPHENPRTPGNMGQTDIFATIETTRGFLSNGITEATTLNGGSGNDLFTIFHNRAVLTANGGSGNDEFMVRAFALAGSQETQRERTDISGGSDADLIQYAVNAPVGIDGGDGTDTLIVIGTEFRDDFVVTSDGVFGAGINVSFVNIEVLKVDGAEGDDRFFVQSTDAGTVTTIAGGLGSDSFNIAGDAPPIISNDLLGHSGKISHTIVTTDANYTEVRVRDVVANVADSNEPGLVITPVSELSRVVEGDVSGVENLAFATYSVVLSRPPRADERVIVTAFAPKPDQEAADLGAKMITFSTSSGTVAADGQTVQLVFTAANWSVSQTVQFTATVDDLTERTKFGNIQHSIASENISNSDPFLIANTGAAFSNDPPTINVSVIAGGTLPTDGTMVGATIRIIGGAGDGQIRGIGAYSGGGNITLTTSWNIVPTASSDFEIRLADGTLFTGDVTAAANNTTLTLANAFPDAFGSVPDNFGGDLRGATLEIVSGTGAGQERLIISNTEGQLTLNKPWYHAPDATSKFQIQMYSAVKAPVVEIRVDETGIVLPAEIDPTSIPGVKVIESLGSTNVIEPFNGSVPNTDSYQLVLTKQPTADVKIYINAEPTITTRGQIFYKTVQVGVDGSDVKSDARGKYLLFTSSNWDTAQTVVVSAVADNVVDGGDTMVFPSIPRVINQIQGPLIIEGLGASELSVGSLGDPVMLPGENNILPSLGNVTSAADTVEGAASIIVQKDAVTAILTKLGVATIADLVTYTFEITNGPGRGQAQIIESVQVSDDVVTFTFGAETDWEVLPDETSSFTLSTTNPNLLVDESEQVDVVTIFNDESVSNDIGTLTSDRLYGLGMGNSLQVGTITFNGGITYRGMENLTLNLGIGNDNLTVNSTHTREDGFQTVTVINAGRGNDTIDVNVADTAGLIAIKGEEGNDMIDAGDSAHAIIAFGDEGLDTLKGGSGDDILIGDIARVDYLGTEGEVVTRFGLQHDFATMFQFPQSDTQVPSNQTNGAVLAANLILTLDHLHGDADIIRGNTGNDIIIGGTGADNIEAGADDDLVFGDHARLQGAISGAALPLALNPVFSFTSIFTGNTDGAGNDVIYGDAGNDILMGQQGADTIFGGTGNDDLIGGHNVADGNDGSDRLDGGAGLDVIAGDNAIITRRGDSQSLLAQDLSGSTRLYSTSGAPNVSSGLHAHAEFADGRDITLLNHVVGENTAYFGHDFIAGGADNDQIFGQMGADTIQGDGSIGMVAAPATVNASVTSGVLAVTASVDGVTDGNDYIEGNAGIDLIFGNLGQDVLIGGSSDLFGLSLAANRSDDMDMIFGGSGTEIDRNDAAAGKFARDADTIMGDNARVITLNGSGYNFDNAYNEVEQLKVRAYTLLDYTAGGTVSDIGAADEIHGEGGNDTIHGMTGHDVLFGEGQDDNIIGGVGSDRIYGGQGVDGILGDDGIIQTSRNGVAEPLSGLDAANIEKLITTQDPTVGAVINRIGEIHKSAEVQAWTSGMSDIIYGGIGDDFIHGGSGDDAISGAEAMSAFYNSWKQGQAGGTFADTTPLNYDPATGKFAAYNAKDPRSLIANFLLNFDASTGGVKINDGIDRIFGDLGNDWIVGGTGTDRMFGGLGDDLINADDNLQVANQNIADTAQYADGDFAFGGGGRDVLIANTGHDRLYDWSGEYNSFIVPFTNFGAPTVNAKISPDAIKFLTALGAGSGADTRLAESNGELGLVTQSDALWNDQQGGPRDPQPGTTKGKYDDPGAREKLSPALSASVEAVFEAGKTLELTDLRIVAQAAVQRWLDSGELSVEQARKLASMNLQIADLGGLKLAQASNDGITIYLDANAAGYGWYVDIDPMNDDEFSGGVATTTEAASAMDLLSVVMHEIGHQLGFEHDETGLMHEVLDPGIRSALLISTDSIYEFDDHAGLRAAPTAHENWVEKLHEKATRVKARSATMVDWGDRF